MEAFIAGWGLDEALRRAEAYRRAGADAILIHSKSTRPDEVLAFAREWAGRHPLVIVPTRYYSTPAAVFRAAGISVVIWANPLVRASIAAMQAVAREVRETETLVRVEDRIAPLDEVFRLQGADELAEAHRLYLSPREARASAVVLAATRGEGLDALTAQRPKGMLPVGGKPLLRRLVDELRRQGIPDVTVVAGWHPEAVDIPGSRTVVNDAHATSGELVSLASAEAGLREDAVVVYGDLLFRSYVLRDLLESDAPVTVVVDSAPAVGGVADHAWCTAPDDRAVFPREVRLLRIASSPGDAPPAGRWIGMARFQGPGRHWLRSALDELRQRSDFERLDVPDLLNHLVQRGDPVRVQFIHGHWLDVNTLEDLGRADAFTQPEGV